jgi:hypothetical protein
MHAAFKENLMTSLRPCLVCAAIVLTALMVGAHGNSQGNSVRYEKEGLSFDYADGWTLADQSNADAQQLTLTKANTDAQITVFVHRGRIDTPEKLVQAKKAFIDPYVKSVNDRFVGWGAKPESSPATSEVGGAAAEGVRIRASLGGDAAEASIFWAPVNGRVVVLTFFRPDNQNKQTMPSYDVIRTSIKVEPPPAKATPSKKPVQ